MHSERGYGRWSRARTAVPCRTPATRLWASSWYVSVITIGRPMSCMPGYCEVRNTHTIGFLTIPRTSIKWLKLWELLAYILNMYSCSNAYRNRAGLAGLITTTSAALSQLCHFLHAPRLFWHTRPSPRPIRAHTHASHGALGLEAQDPGSGRKIPAKLHAHEIAGACHAVFIPDNWY